MLYLNPVTALGGAEISLIELLRGLDRARFAPQAVLPGPGPLARSLHSLQVPVEFFPLLRFKRPRHPLTGAHYILNWALTVPCLAAFIRRCRIDLVHANSTSAHLYAAPAARLARRPCLWQVRDLIPLGRLGRVLGQLSTGVVAISHAVADSLAAAGLPREKIVTVWNGVDPWVFHPGGGGSLRREEWGIPKEAFVVVLAAQFVPWKGHRVLLEAAPELLRRVPSAYLLLVGTDLFGDHPDYQPCLQARAQGLGLAERVLFPGYRRDMPAVLEAADVLVCASEGEPFGRTLIEAMSLAKPVVATDAGGPREIVVDGETGFLVPRGDAAALAAALIRLAQHPWQAQAMGQRGRRRVLKLFTTTVQVRRMEKLYGEIMLRKT